MITITAKSGKSWQAKVAQVVWRGPDRYGKGDVALVATERLSSYGGGGGGGGGCHTGGDCSSLCSPRTCPCGDGEWFTCC